MNDPKVELPSYFEPRALGFALFEPSPLDA